MTLLQLPVPSANGAVAQTAAAGLLSRPKKLPYWLFYDARGSELFECITELPEYYPTRTERRILKDNAARILEGTAPGRPLSVVELGAGSAKKTELLLAALVKIQGGVDFYPADVSQTALLSARQRLAITLPEANVMPLVGTHQETFRALRNIPGPKLILFIGSSIGNFEPAEAQAFLRALRAQLALGDSLLLGTDLRKDPALMVRAYADDAGVTAAFNLNILARLNRELGANFALDRFKHVALWNESASRIEMHIESCVTQSVDLPVPDITVRFHAGERIHTESCYKFDEHRVNRLLEGAGFVRHASFTDRAGYFAVHLAKAAGAQA